MKDLIIVILTLWCCVLTYLVWEQKGHIQTLASTLDRQEEFHKWDKAIKLQKKRDSILMKAFVKGDSLLLSTYLKGL